MRVWVTRLSTHSSVSIKWGDWLFQQHTALALSDARTENYLHFVSFELLSLPI